MKCVQTIVDSEGIDSIAMTSNNQIIASTDRIRVKLWNFKTGELLRVLKKKYSGGLCNALAISPDNKLIAGACDEYSVCIWNLETGEHLKTVKYSTEFEHPYTSIVFCPDGVSLISGGMNHTDGWNIETGKWCFSPTRIGDRLAISPNSHVVAGYLSNVEISEIPHQRPLQKINHLSACVGAVAITSDGKTCAAGLYDGIIKIWDWATCKELITINAHSDVVESIAFSPDGEILVSASSDKMIKFWEVKTGKLKKSSEKQLGEIYQVLYSSNGQYLVSRDNQKTIKIWQL